MKNLIVLIISFLPFITAGQFVLDIDKIPPEKRRKNEIILTPASEKYYLNTYFKEDEKVKLGSSDPATVEEFYLSPIELTKTADGITATYRGPLYAQCGGSGEDHCAIQSYSIQLDACGELIKIDEKTDLKIYQPGVLGKHAPISIRDISRMTSYSNSPAILERLYTDIGGPDLESNYILGNSLVQGSIFGLNDYSIVNRSRWGLNPWGTNTAATFFIHLSMIRKAIRQLFPDQSPCGKVWPEFLGRTPLNSETPDSANWNPIFKDYQNNLKLLNIAFGDIRNGITESVIQKELVCINSPVSSPVDIRRLFENMIQPLIRAQFVSNEESDFLYQYFTGTSSVGQTKLSSDLNYCKNILEKVKYLGQLVELTRPHPPLSEAEKLAAFHAFFKAFTYFKYRGDEWIDIDQKGLPYFEQILQNDPNNQSRTTKEVKERWDLIVQAAPVNLH